MTETVGRRERKKAATRRALADAAMRLFLEHGYHQVGIRDVADAADVSTTTLFKYFPTKESLVFDEDEGREEALVAAVRDRPAGMGVLAALRAYVSQVAAQRGADPVLPEFLRLVDRTPELSEYARQMWVRHQRAVAVAVAEAVGVDPDDVRCAAVARFVLEAPALARTRRDPAAALAEVFSLIEGGWRATGPTGGGASPVGAAASP